MNYNGTPYPITQLTPEQMDKIRMSATTAKANEDKVLIEAANQVKDKQRRQSQIIKIKRLQAKIRRLSRDLDKGLHPWKNVIFTITEKPEKRDFHTWKNVIFIISERLVTEIMQQIDKGDKPSADILPEYFRWQENHPDN